MGAYKGLSEFFKDIAGVAKDLNYSKSNLLILSNDLKGLMKEYPDVYSNLRTCRHNMDRRSPFEYAQDLVASWIFEDYFVDLLKNDDFKIELSGADRTREILNSSKVSASSDATLIYKDTSLKLEIMNDYTGYWTKRLKFNLRDDKYLKLKKSKSLFIGISTIDKKYMIFDFGTDVPFKFIPHHFPYGNKPCYEINLQLKDLKSFDKDNIVKDLLNILKQK